MVQQKERISRELTLIYHKEEDGIVLEEMDSRSAQVVIPEQINGIPVVGIQKKAFFNSRFLVSLTLPITLKRIGDWAFAYCPKLIHVSLPRKEMELGKSLFLGSDKLEEIELTATGCHAFASEQEARDIPALLAAAILLLDAEYLVTTAEAGSGEWLRKWDTRLLEIVRRSDMEGFTKQVLCGEEDYGSTDMGLYQNRRRKEKVHLCFTRLLHSYGVSPETQQILTDYLLEHTCGCEQDETWEMIRTEYAHKREYYEFFTEIGGLTSDNFDMALADLGERQPELKAYLMRYKEENLGYTDFFDSLSLDFDF